MRVVVTGGSGLAGFAVVRHLLEHGHAVISIDRAPLPQPLTEQRLVDCADLGQVYGACRSADAIVHLAAIPRPIFHTPEVVFRSNTLATFNVFEAAAALEIPRVVYISSISVLGLPFNYAPVPLVYFPIDESHPRAPQDAYALSKTLGEDIALAFTRRMAGRLTAVSLRFPWIHSPQSFAEQVTPLWDDAAGGAPNLWSYIDTRDVARACALSLEVPVSGHEAFFVSAANTFMKGNTAELVGAYYPEAEIRAELVGNQALIDTSKAERVLGYKAAYSWEEYEWS
jgi:nucleoside-diphosphate-sugar epimerase